MSRTDPFQDLSNAGAAGDPNRVPGEGTARVETRVTGGGSGMSGGRSTDEMLGRASDQAQETWDRARNRAEDAYGEARQRADEWGDRAGDYAARARNEVGGMLDRAEDRLEEQTGAVSMIRENPLLAAGLAFGTGFLLAGGRSRKRSGLMSRATGQIRSAIIGGVSTMLMQELQDMMDEHGGPVGLLNALTGRDNNEMR